MVSVFLIPNRQESFDLWDGKSSVLIHDETLSTASGPTPTSAARKASIMALEAIKEDASLLSKCDCRGRVKDKNSWMAQGFSRALSSLIEEHSDGTGDDGIQTEMRVAAD
jgi:hypothetical protein